MNTVKQAMALAPIALFAYNRPSHLKQTIEALCAARQAPESQLWVFCDGPKDSRHVKNVAEVRALARSIKGFASVHVIERERNLGLAASVTEGVTRLCAEYGRVIVLEDDLLVAPEFLAFMNAALSRYADDERVYQISGYMYPEKFDGPDDAVFLPATSCWGWATWKRAWDCYDPSASGFARLRTDRSLRLRFNLDGAFDYYGMLERQMSGEIDSWGVRWLLSVFTRDGLVLYPRSTLVRNIGMDGSGTHGAGHALLQQTSGYNRLDIDAVRFPAVIEVDISAMSRLTQFLRSLQPGPVRRLVNWFAS